MLTVLIFVLVLGLLVFVHELGHFITARRNGIKAEEFGFGFPPRLVGFVKDEFNKGYHLVWGNHEVVSAHTVYSINWLPLGGFVRIKGEDPSEEGAQDADSFATKPIWARFKVLVAGVIMNFLFAWFLIAVAYMLGVPQPIDPAVGTNDPNAKIQISSVEKGSPAETMGLQVGDQILRVDKASVKSLSEVSDRIRSAKGTPVAIDILRGKERLTLSGTPRVNAPEGEGPLGISFTETTIVRYSLFQAVWEGLRRTLELTWMILAAFGSMIAGIFTEAKVPTDIAGPIGIVYLTKQVSELGFVYLLQFAAVLSVNLGIVNALPIPALDGGRIFFLLIEKLRGRPVTRALENRVNQIGFLFLLLLMVLVTFHDFAQFHLWQKIMGIL